MELAELAQNYFGDTRSGTLAGPIGGLFVGLLALFTIFLIRNMNARLRRLPERFPEPADPDRPGEDRVGEQSAAPGPGSDHRTG